MRPSSITRLDAPVREAIARLREQGRTIDEIVTHLRGLDVEVSRSAMGRHVRAMDAMGEKLRRSRSVAEAMVRALGDAPESRTARLNIELMHSALLDLHLRAQEGEEIDPDGRAALAGNPEGAMQLARAIDHLTSAARRDADFVKVVEERASARAKTIAAAAMMTEARARGVSAETIAAIKASIFGVAKGAGDAAEAGS